jgi:tetratricopeptide (TPR) repeat protein
VSSLASRWLRADWPALAAESRVRLLQALALGVALAVAPGLLGNVIDLPKRLLVESLVILGWGTLVLEGAAGGGIPVRATPLGVPFLAVLGVQLVSGGRAANPGLALEQTWLVAAWGALVVLMASGMDRSVRPRVASALLLAGGLEAVYGILQYAGIDFLPWASSWGSRCFGTIGNPIFYAEFLAPLFVLTVALLVAEEDEERKDLLALLTLVEFLALVFAQTRSAWLGSAAGLGVLAAALLRGGTEGRALVSRNRSWLLALGGFAVAVVVTISSSAVFGRNALPLKERVRDMFDFKGWTVQHRVVLWRAGGVILRDDPVLGAGPDHFRSGFPLAQATFRAAYAKRSFHFPPKEQKAHSDYVQWAAELGLVGLGAWLWLLAVLARLGWRAVESADSGPERAFAGGLLGGCIALAVDAWFNFPFRIVAASAVFWMFAGLLVARSRDGVPRAGDAWFASAGAGRRRATAAVTVAVAAVWIVWLVWPAIRADRAQAEGEQLEASGFHERAVDEFEQSLSARPFDALVEYELGFALWNSSTFDWTGHTWDRALFHLERARRMGLNDELLFAREAIIFERKDKIAAAIREGEMAVRIYPDQMDHVANLAYWYALKGERLPEALELANRAVGAVPQHPLYHWTRGLVLEKLGRIPEAVREVAAAIPLLHNLSNGPGYRADVDRDLARLRARAAARRARVPQTNLQTF